MPADPRSNKSPALRLVAPDADRTLSHQEFLAARARLLAKFERPERHAEAREALDQLYIDRRRQTCGAGDESDAAARMESAAVIELRELIAACLEDGLLRHSRRQLILSEAQQRGISPFNAHLLIAQVQFGGRPRVAFSPTERPLDAAAAMFADTLDAPRVRARLTAIGLMAAALFLGLVRWSGLS